MKKDSDKEEERLWALQQEANRQMQLANEMEIKRKQQEMMAAQRDTNQDLKLEKNQRWSNFYGEKDELPPVEGIWSFFIIIVSAFLCLGFNLLPRFLRLRKVSRYGPIELLGLLKGWSSKRPFASVSGNLRTDSHLVSLLPFF